MPTIIVYTDHGVPVERLHIDSLTANAMTSRYNALTAAFVGTVQRAVSDAEKIDAGRSPLRDSERAMHAAMKALDKGV